LRLKDELKRACIKRRSGLIAVGEDAHKGMKEMGMEDWLIGAIMEFNNQIKAGYASKMTDVVKQITGRKPILFAQFAKDYGPSRFKRSQR
jgi:hypothetical protein